MYSLEQDELVGIRLDNDELIVSSSSKSIVVDGGVRHRLEWMRGRLQPKSWRALQNNSMILSAALFWLTMRKEKSSSDSGWFRGTAAPQLLIHSGKAVLYLYEAGYRGSIYPRFRWIVEEYDIVDALFSALCRELENEELIAEIDGRIAASVELVP